MQREAAWIQGWCLRMSRDVERERMQSMSREEDQEPEDAGSSPSFA